MKAKVIDTDYYTSNFEVGEIVEIMQGMESDSAEIWNAPSGKVFLCKRKDGTMRYNFPLNLQIVEDDDSREKALQAIKVKAAIAALPKCIESVETVLLRGGAITEKDMTTQVAQMCLQYANALIKKIEE